MSGLLDYIVSEEWAFYIAFLFFASLPSVVLIRPPFKDKLIPKRTVQIGVSVLAFSTLMYILLSHHGYAVQFIQGMSNDEVICLTEEHYEGDGDGGSYETYRLYTIDMKTGECLLRMNIESPEMLCVKENSVVFFLWSSAVEYDFRTGEQINEWSKEKGFEKFDALKCGIKDLNRSSDHFAEQNNAWLTITANDGHYYCYNLLTDELTATQYPPDDEPEKYKFDEYEFRIKHPEDYYQDSYFTFEKVTGEIEQLIFKNYRDSVKVYNGEFLHPSVVGYSEKDRLFIVRHFETLEDKHSILTAVSFDLESVWRVEQKQIAPSDKWGDNPNPGLILKSNDHLICTFGGTVVLLSISDGSVVWSTSL
ncbi:MAG: hypothetical protein IPM77_02215 [Crocinitomicaceae bacterium]|nr:hypothetical protein [Crocinitomicaceae bacterium]